VTGPKGSATITREDVEAAQAVVEAGVDEIVQDHDTVVSGKATAFLRGLITQALADAHARGYDHGVARGRRLVANAVRDALDSEGLL